MHILQWARANGCPWDSSTCSGAAAGGHLPIAVKTGVTGTD